MNQQQNFCRVQVKPNSDGSTHTVIFSSVFTQPKSGYVLDPVNEAKWISQQAKDVVNAALQSASEMVTDLAKNPPKI